MTQFTSAGTCGNQHANITGFLLEVMDLLGRLRHRSVVLLSEKGDFPTDKLQNKT